MSESTLQKLVNEAYDKWIKHDWHLRSLMESGQLSEDDFGRAKWSWSDLIENSDEKTKVALVVGKLYQQLMNGGVLQWIDNLYAKYSVPYLRECLHVVGPISREVGDIVMTFLSDFATDDYEHVVDTDEASFYADMTDNAIYRLNDDDRWLKEIEGYFDNDG